MKIVMSRKILITDNKGNIIIDAESYFIIQISIFTSLFPFDFLFQFDSKGVLKSGTYNLTLGEFREIIINEDEE